MHAINESCIPPFSLYSATKQQTAEAASEEPATDAKAEASEPQTSEPAAESESPKAESTPSETPAESAPAAKVRVLSPLSGVRLGLINHVCV